MNIVEQAQRQKNRRQLFSGRPVILAKTKTYQDFLDRAWPGVFLAYNPQLSQFVLQDRRCKSPHGWYVISVMEPHEWPSIHDFGSHLAQINVTGLKSQWESDRWYDKELGEPDESLAKLNEQSMMAALAREVADKMQHIINPKTSLHMGV